MIQANAEILLLQADGSVILQVRDDTPGITNPALISSFGGHIEKGEEPIDAALREINEETNLKLTKDQLLFYDKRRKTQEIHGEDWDVYYFAVQGVDIKNLSIFEGTGFTVIRNLDELKDAKTTVLLGEVLTDYFEGFRKYLFYPNIDGVSRAALFNDYLKEILKGHEPSPLRQPVVLACAGLVASGKSTITSPLAQMADCVTVSSDHIREEFFKRGFNFNSFRALMSDIITTLAIKKYNIFLDFNIATNLPTLDGLFAKGYRSYIIHANPPETFIKDKILSGKMKHELSFFPKDAHVYRSFLGWRDEHLKNLSKVKNNYGIWREVDTSSTNLSGIIENLKNDFMLELQKLEL